MGVNSLPKTVTRQRRGYDLNPGPSAPESSTLTTLLTSHPVCGLYRVQYKTDLKSEMKNPSINLHSQLSIPKHEMKNECRCPGMNPPA